MIRISIIGNLAADAEVKESNGSRFITFRVADTRKWVSKGTTVEETQWASCIMNATDGNLIDYLKTGVKVYVEGMPTIDIYSSPKLRRMVGRYNISVTHVELCGGSSDLVPKQLVDDSGVIVDIHKAFYIDPAISKEYVGRHLYGKRGGLFGVDTYGYVWPVEEQQQPTQQDEGNQAQAAEQENSSAAAPGHETLTEDNEKKQAGKKQKK